MISTNDIKGKSGVELIGLERAESRIQWGDGHDDKHTNGVLVSEAIYRAADSPFREIRPEGDLNLRFRRIRQIMEAGALLASEIDRLQRLP